MRFVIWFIAKFGFTYYNIRVEIACAISMLAQRVKCVVEGAGASTFAAVLFKKFKYEKDEKIVCVLSGGNIAMERLSECFEESKEFLKQH